MNIKINIRELKPVDLNHAKRIVDENKMFPSEYLDDMTKGFLLEQTSDEWFVAENDTKDVVAITYCAPERMTEGTWNLLLIAVAKKYQGQGIGHQLMLFVENYLREKDVRVLLVETSGLPEFELTRKFYPLCGYQHVATIPEYYDKGDDKVVFWKSLV